MTTIIRRALLSCLFVAAAMIASAPALAQSQAKTDKKEVTKEKGASCCADKKDATASADKKECADKDCCADGKDAKHEGHGTMGSKEMKEKHDKMMKEKETEKKEETKKDGDGR